MNLKKPGLLKQSKVFFILLFALIFTPCAAFSYEIDLTEGWNLISLPEQPENVNVSQVTAAIENKLISMWAYKDGHWLMYTPENPDFSDLQTISSGTGYWINISEAAVLSGQGTGTSEGIVLAEGWNLVGFNGNSQKNIADALSDLDNANIVSIWSFKGPGWEVYNPDEPDFSDLASLKPGHGYWINISDGSIPEPAIDEKARLVLASLESGDTAAITSYVSPDFIQHNLSLQDGKQAFIDAAATGMYSDTTVDIERLFVDGSYVITHSDYTISGERKVVFDIFRFENGLIVEHWDNYQTWVPMSFGTTMLDGPTEVTDTELTAANKTLVQNFAQTCLVDGQWSSYTDYIDDGVYTQHNPSFASGTNWIKNMADGTKLYDEIKYVFGEGNFVVAVSQNGSKSVYDMWRVEKNRIVEHWDVVEQILPEDQQQNSNGKF